MVAKRSARSRASARCTTAQSPAGTSGARVPSGVSGAVRILPMTIDDEAPS